MSEHPATLPEAVKSHRHAFNANEVQLRGAVSTPAGPAGTSRQSSLGLRTFGPFVISHGPNDLAPTALKVHRLDPDSVLGQVCQQP